MEKKILITLATGKTGYETALQLLEEGYPVKIMVRSRNQKALELEKSGAEIAIGEFNNYGQIKNALLDVSRVYYCYPIKKGMAEDVAVFIQAAKEMKTEAVVFMGQWLAEFENQQSFQTKSIQQSYKLLEQSGLNVVYLIPGYFAENNIGVLLEFAVQLGILASPFGNGKNPVPSNEDLAACIAALLKNPQPYYGQRLRPTGSKSLSVKEMADIITKVTGKKIRIINSPEWMFLKAAFSMKDDYGYDAFTIAQAIHYNREYQQNKFDIGGATNIVKQLTGNDPEDFETIIRRFIETSSYGMPNRTGWFKALIKFMKIPFQKVPSIKELDRLNK
ncbi:NmrA family NAD(P)-binding protein [Parasediminibacterium sp. JCM 36343]|uniref:NmrA family NAD(P)-binding protein n=1 Tax=Parasediminibacterium sp. JCM 36343 TaxID=3374279 RepID=UPI00397DF27A